MYYLGYQSLWIETAHEVHELQDADPAMRQGLEEWQRSICGDSVARKRYPLDPQGTEKFALVYRREDFRVVAVIGVRPWNDLLIVGVSLRGDVLHEVEVAAVVKTILEVTEPEISLWAKNPSARFKVFLESGPEKELLATQLLVHGFTRNPESELEFERSVLLPARVLRFKTAGTVSR